VKPVLACLRTLAWLPPCRAYWMPSYLSTTEPLPASPGAVPPMRLALQGLVCLCTRCAGIWPLLLPPLICGPPSGALDDGRAGGFLLLARRGFCPAGLSHGSYASFARYARFPRRRPEGHAKNGRPPVAARTATSTLLPPSARVVSYQLSRVCLGKRFTSIELLRQALGPLYFAIHEI